MTWHGAWLYGVHRTLWDGSNGFHQSIQQPTWAHWPRDQIGSLWGCNFIGGRGLQLTAERGSLFQQLSQPGNQSEPRRCVKVVVVVLGSPSLIVIVLMVSMDVRRHWTKSESANSHLRQWVHHQHSYRSHSLLLVSQLSPAMSTSAQLSQSLLLVSPLSRQWVHQHTPGQSTISGVHQHSSHSRSHFWSISYLWST